MASRWLKPKGYADGGKVMAAGSPIQLGVFNAKADPKMKTDAVAPGTKDQNVKDVEHPLPAAAKELGAARGGKIEAVAGKPIGKDDGLIPVQVGEYVVKKSAVKKLGTAFLDQINKGRVPGHPLYDHPRSRPSG